MLQNQNSCKNRIYFLRFCKKKNREESKTVKIFLSTRVDVSETFSADQLWFRILSGLFQRCSIPENLWTALIQLWTALKTEIFRAENQRWNSAVSALIFSETALNSADSWIIQNDNCWFIFHYVQNFSKYLNFEAHNSRFQPILRKEVSNKNWLLHFRTGQRYNKYLNFWVYCYCLSNKTDMVQLFKNNFAFVGVKFQVYSKKFEFLLSIYRIFTFSLIQEYHFNDHFVRFQHFGLRYHILIVSSTCVSIRADSE